MAAAENLRWGWFRYTADDGSFWAIRADKEWGANVQSGLGAFVQADPAWPSTKRYRIRKCALVDPNTGIVTKRTIGTVAAAAGVRGTVVTDFVRGSAGLNTFNSTGLVNERRPKTKPIISPPDSTTA
jgi:hypothetical protein